MINELSRELRSGVLEEIESYLSDFSHILSSTLWSDIDINDINEIFRIVHSIKGNGKVGGFEDLTVISHQFENILTLLREGTIHFNEDLKSLCMLYIHYLTDALDLLKTNVDFKIDFRELEKKLLKIDPSIANIKSETVKKSINNNQDKNENERQLEKIINMNILIIDDDFDFANYIATHVKASLKIESERAVDGVEGLVKANKKQYALIVCDYNMPNMNGKEFIDNIKNKIGPNKNSPIIFTSAYQPEHLLSPDWENVVYLQKPINKKKLINYVRFGIISLLKN